MEFKTRIDIEILLKVILEIKPEVITENHDWKSNRKSEPGVITRNHDQKSQPEEGIRIDIGKFYLKSYRKSNRKSYRVESSLAPFLYQFWDQEAVTDTETVVILIFWTTPPPNLRGSFTENFFSQHNQSICPIQNRRTRWLQYTDQCSNRSSNLFCSISFLPQALQ